MNIQRALWCILPLFISCAQANEDSTYYTFGIGVDMPNKSVSSSGDSFGILYRPTTPGTSLFQLPNVEWDNKFKTGLDVNFAYGYRFTENLRGEVEALYQRFNRKISGSYDFLETDSITTNVFDRVNNNPIEEATGHVTVYSLMTNALCDFEYDCNWTPFIGAGFGIAWIHAHSTSAYNVLNIDYPVGGPTTTPNIQTSPGLTGTSFALQFKAGVSYAICDNLAAILQYRLFATTRFVAKSSHIHTNPGVDGDSVFSIPESSVSGLVNSMVDICIQFG